MGRRGYTKQRRAQQEARTRERIVAATAELHGSLGPRDTTISAIAERAGVQRLTVYRHFPDQDALFRACTAHWLERHPPPDPAAWAGQADPAARTHAALVSVYGYYRGTAAMWRLSYRDLDRVPALQGPMAGFQAYLDGIRDDLAACWLDRAVDPGGRLAATLDHALAFRTWDALSAHGRADEAIAGLAIAWLRGVLERGD